MTGLMKVGLVLLSCIVTFEFVSAQTVEITTNVGELYRGAHNLGAKAKFKVTENETVMYASCPKYITETIDAEKLKELNRTTYKFDLEKITYPDTSFKSKKIRVSQIRDISRKSGVYLKDFMDNQGDIENVQGSLLKPVREQFRTANYNVVDLDFDIFGNASRGIRFLISGEILDYDHETRGTSGFKINTQIRWIVFDNKSKEEVYTITTGGYSNSLILQSQKKELQLAIVDALNGLLCSKDFQEIVSVEAPDAVFTYKGITIPEKFKKNNNQKITSFVEFSNGSATQMGTFISKEGYIITGKVDSSKLGEYAKLSNGVELPILWMTTNEDLQLSILRIEGNGFPNLELRFDSTQLRTETLNLVSVKNPSERLIQTKFKGYDNNGNLIMESSASSPSPVIDEDNQIVGFSNLASSQQNLAIPMHTILNTFEIKQED